MVSSCDRYIHALFDGALDGMVIASDDGHCVDVNPAACTLFGLHRDEVIGRRIADFGQADLGEPAWAALLAQKTAQGRICLERRGGELREVEYRLTASIAPHQHLLVLRDVTEQRQLERQVQQLRQHLDQRGIPQTRPLHRLLDYLPVCIAYVDRDRRYRYINQTYQTWFHLPVDAILGQPIAQVIGADAYRLVQPHVDRALAGDWVTYELAMPYQQGGTRYVQTTLIPDPDGQGGIQGVYGLVLDLSDRHQLELALQSSQQKYQTLFKILPIGVSMTDAQGNLVEANPASERILGISADEHTRRSYDEPTWQILRPDGSPMPVEEYASVRALRENRTITGQEQGIVCPDGTVRWISVSAAPLPLEAYGVAIAYGDITLQKQTELALRTQEQQYRRATQAGHVGVWDWNLNTHEIYLDPILKQMLGYEDWEIRNHLDDWGQYVYAEDRPAVMAAAQDHLAGLTPEYCVEHRMVHRDGSLRWFLARGVALRSPDGTPYRVLGTDSDITDRKLADIALRESNAYYQSLADALPQCLYRKDREGRCTFANRALLTMTGQSLEDLVGKTVYELYPPDLAAKYAVDDAWVMETGQILDTVETHLSLATGEPLHVQIVKAPVRNAQGEITGTQGIFWDVSDRIRLEQSLRESEAKLRAILSNTAAVIISAQVFRDRSYTYDYCSAACETIFGYTTTELMGDRTLWWSRVHPDDIAAHVLPSFDAIFAEQPFQFEYRFHHRDGSWRWLSVAVTSQWDETFGGWYVTKVHTDISDRQAAETALRQREQEFRTLVENAPDGIWRVDRQFRFLYANPVVQRLTGIPAAAFVGQALDAMGFEDAVIQLWRSVMQRVFETGQEQVLESQITLQGTRETFYSRIVPEVAPDGSTPSVLVISRNISTLKRAQDALMRLAEQESTLRLITQHIRETLDLEAILTTTVTEIQRTFKADRTLIFRLHRDRSGVITHEAVRPEYPVTLEMRWDDECFPPACYDFYCQGQARIVPNVRLDSWGECLVGFMQQTGVQSKIVAPILQTQEDGAVGLWGLLIVHACETPRVWKLEEADLVQQVATQLAIAIHQSELYETVQTLNTNLEQQVQERTAQLQRSYEFEAILNRITERLRDSLDEQRILTAMISELAQHLGITFGNIALYDTPEVTPASPEATRVVSEYNALVPPLTGLVLPANHFPEIEQQLRHNLQFQCCVCPVDLGRWVSILLSPIVDEHGTTLGDILLLREPHQAFDGAEVQLVQQVANQCAIALRQSRLYQAAQTQVLELERLNQLKDDFLSTVSHELRSPMANIKVAMELLEVQLTQLGVLPLDLPSDAPTASPVERYFQILKDESSREMSLINDLLDLARLDAQTEPLFPTPIDLQTWIPHLLEPFDTHIQQAQQQLILHLSPDLPPLISDPAPLQRVLMELMTNACKYTPAGERIEVFAQAQGDWLELRIANSGVEIPPVECDRIFDRFYRIPNMDPWKHGGTGLGLALTKKLVEFLQGTIRAECQGGYVHIIVHLPLHLTVAP